MSRLKVFGLGNKRDREYAKNIAAHINTVAQSTVGMAFPALNRHSEERRPDGEAYTVSLDNVRGCDVFVISSLYGDENESVDEKLTKLCIFINSLRHASAERITVCAPYLCYARQDRKTESRAPIATQAVAIMLESLGAKRLLTMDVHNLGAEQNAFRIPLDNLEAKKLLADQVADLDGGVTDYAVMTPDAGGAKRAKEWQEAFQRRIGREVGFAYADKTRRGAEDVKVKIIGDVKGKQVIVVDDMVGTGRTAGEISAAVKRGGGEVWGLVATHGLFTGSAAQWLADIPRIFVTDTVSPYRVVGKLPHTQLTTVSTTRLFADAIHRIHTEGGSISQLLED